MTATVTLYGFKVLRGLLLEIFEIFSYANMKYAKIHLFLAQRRWTFVSGIIRLLKRSLGRLLAIQSCMLHVFLNLVVNC